MPVNTLGVYGDDTTLVGHVKLKAGAGITLTRVDADNAIQITGAKQGAQVSTYTEAGKQFQRVTPTVVFSHT